MKHNPDNLTDEQIGVAHGWRILEKDEVELTSPCRLYAIECWSANRWLDGGYYGHGTGNTYRTRLTRAELRKARGLEPEQPPSNPAGPAAIGLCPCGAELPCNCSYSPPSDPVAQQPVEAVSGAALEATNKIMSALVQMDVLDFETPSQSNSAWDGMLADIERAITAATADLQQRLSDLSTRIASANRLQGLTEANLERSMREADALREQTAAQQAEITALREERDALLAFKEHDAYAPASAYVALTKIVSLAHNERDAARRETRETKEKFAMLLIERDALRAELATTRERLAKCEASFKALRDRVSDVLNRIEHDLTGDLDGDVAFEFDELLEILTKALAAQPLDRGAK